MLAQYFMEIEEFSETSYMTKFLPRISLEKQDRVSRLQFEMDRKLEVYSEALLRTLICESLPIANQDIVFRKKEHGKPYLANNPGFHFNISHTRNALAVAIGDLPVGIDIEKCREADQSVALGVFSSQEYDYIYSHTKNVNLRFYEVWTRKESYLKWTGEGLSLDINRNNQENNAISVQVVTTRIGQYIISTCTEMVNINSLIIHLSEQEFLKRTEIICRS